MGSEPRMDALARAGRLVLSAGLLVIIICVATLSVHAQTPLQISLSPLVIELAGERGQTLPFSITIVNNSRFQAADFRAYVTGLHEGRSGGVRTKNA